MDSLQSLLKFKKFSSSVTGNEFAERLEQALLERLQAFHAEVQKLRGEVHPDKFQERVQQRAQAILTELDQGPGGLLRMLGSRWATARGVLERKSGLAHSTDAASLSRENWLCDRLAAMDPAQQLQTLERAVETGDVATMRAALHAPPALRILQVDSRVVEQARAAWYRKQCPTEVAEFESLAHAYQVEQDNFKTACDCIKQIAGIGTDMRERLEAPAQK